MQEGYVLLYSVVWWTWML